MSADDSTDTVRVQPFRVGRLTQFGYSFFRPDAQGFASLTDVPVGPDYVLGSGDRVTVTLWGSVDGSFELEVNRSGEIVLPRVGAVKVAGVSFGQLPRLLNGQLSKVFTNFHLNVSMGKLRMIKVYLVGEVKSPGDYNISSLSTLINALSAAGGPTRNGSLRSIVIKRDGKVVDSVDLYDFFLKGDKSRDIRLQAGDTIFVPSIGPVVGIAGNVRRPAIYELKHEKSLKDLLALADGIVSTGYLQRLQISRIEAHDKKVVTDVSLDSKSSDKSLDELTASIPIKDMDLVKIFPIDFTVRDQARLDGYVLRPGFYTLKSGMRVKDLIGTDNLLPEYFPDTLEITRLVPPDFHPEKLYVNLERAMLGHEEDNILLTEFDSVRVYSRFEMEEMPVVTISGEVLRPGSYRLNKNERVADLVKEGGNLKRQGYAKKVEIRRLRYGKDRIVPYSVYVDLEEAFKGNPAQNVLLEPFDEVVVKKWDQDNARVVRINGEVHRPGEYRLVDGMTIADLIHEAGNIKRTAYLQNAEIVRLKVTGSSVTSYPITVSLDDALRGDPQANVQLQGHDEVMVRRLPEWMDETDRYVILKGEVQFPGTYPIFKGEKLSSVLRRAGGYTNKAYLKGGKFTRRSVRDLQQRRMDDVIARTEQDLGRKQQEMASVASSKDELEATRATVEGMRASLEKLKAAKAEGRISIKLAAVEELVRSPYDLELQGGDALEIPQSTNSVLVFGEVYNPTTVVHIPGENLGFYLKKAGGATVNGEEDEMYVIRADGTVESRKQRVSFLFYDGFERMGLDPGDTLVVPQVIEKVAWMRELKDIAFIIGQTALAAGVLVAAGL
ncbi:MAG: hypothetical protein A2075_12850 [Geobacteraceae bacterium GWC2_58_44]|nr:MAG: hypothetical protein A2075_12850 [Geobacteraceae bacterium GWC2_58_44]